MSYIRKHFSICRNGCCNIYQKSTLSRWWSKSQLIWEGWSRCCCMKYPQMIYSHDWSCPAEMEELPHCKVWHPRKCWDTLRWRDISPSFCWNWSYFCVEELHSCREVCTHLSLFNDVAILGLFNRKKARINLLKMYSNNARRRIFPSGFMPKPFFNCSPVSMESRQMKYVGRLSVLPHLKYPKVMIFTCGKAVGSMTYNSPSPSVSSSTY